jgi:hypothetical protein
MKLRIFSGRSWFRKGREAESTKNEIVEVAIPIEVFNVEDYVAISDPLAAANKRSISIEPPVIAHCIYSIFGQEESDRNSAVLEYFYPLTGNTKSGEITQYSFNAGQGFSAKVNVDDKIYTVLIGHPPVVSRSATPFHEAFEPGVMENPETLCVAIDGIVFATFWIKSSFI